MSKRLFNHNSVSSRHQLNHTMDSLEANRNQLSLEASDRLTVPSFCSHQGIFGFDRTRNCSFLSFHWVGPYCKNQKKQEKVSYLWRQSRFRPSQGLSGDLGCSVRGQRWWKLGACRRGQSSGSSGPPRCGCCRGRQSGEWGRAPRAGPRSAGSPNGRTSPPSGRPAVAGSAGGTRLSGRWCGRRCSRGRDSVGEALGYQRRSCR